MRLVMLINNFKKTALTCTALFFVVIVVPTATQAQSTDYHPFTFGLKGGLNLTTFLVMRSVMEKSYLCMTMYFCITQGALLIIVSPVIFQFKPKHCLAK